MKRGQAAMEYLTTYGWVILVVIVGMGAISYFGFLSPSNYLPDRCYFGAQLICEDYQLLGGSSSGFDMKIRNNFQKVIRITDVNEIDANFPIADCPDLPIQIKVSAIEEVSCTLGASLSTGDKYSIPLMIEFERNGSGSAPAHNVSGEIFSEAS